ncbi:hypothetical protein B0H14DRAFT_3443753 [Mycena olivaceomarginata]|nr:hypothetical protein B0H14DRAFT_3443753 [Mycena olivaceomarginata]
MLADLDTTKKVCHAADIREKANTPIGKRQRAAAIGTAPAQTPCLTRKAQAISEKETVQEGTTSRECI